MMSRRLLLVILATRLLWWALLSVVPPLPVHPGEGTLVLPWKPRADGTAWLYHPDRRIDAWGRNDSPYYFEIALLGYQPPPLDRPTKEGFFPGYPWLVRVVKPLVHRGLLGGAPDQELLAWALGFLLVSQLLSVVALALFERLGNRLYGNGLGTKAAIGLAISPFSFVLGSALTDGPFLALSLFAATQAERGRWLLAGLASAGASSVRIFGVALLALGVRIIQVAKRWRFPAAIGYSLLVLAGLGFAFVIYDRECGDPFAYFKVQRLFGHESFPSLSGVRELVILRGYGPFELARKSLQLLVLGIGLFALWCAARDVRSGKLPWPYWVLGAAWFSAPILADNLISLPRYALAAFPLYLALLVRAPAGVRGCALGAASLVIQGFLLLTWEAHWPLVI